MTTPHEWKGEFHRVLEVLYPEELSYCSLVPTSELSRGDLSLLGVYKLARIYGMSPNVIAKKIVAALPNSLQKEVSVQEGWINVPVNLFESFEESFSQTHQKKSLYSPMTGGSGDIGAELRITALATLAARVLLAFGDEVSLATRWGEVSNEGIKDNSLLNQVIAANKDALDLETLKRDVAGRSFTLLWLSPLLYTRQEVSSLIQSLPETCVLNIPAKRWVKIPEKEIEILRQRITESDIDLTPLFLLLASEESSNEFDCERASFQEVGNDYWYSHSLAQRFREVGIAPLTEESPIEASARAGRERELLHRIVYFRALSKRMVCEGEIAKFLTLARYVTQEGARYFHNPDRRRRLVEGHLEEREGLVLGGIARCLEDMSLMWRGEVLGGGE